MLLKRKLPLIAMVFTVISGALIASLVLWQTHRLANQQLILQGESAATQLAKTIQEPLIQKDRLSQQVELDQVLNQAGISSVELFDRKKKRLGLAEKSLLNKGNHPTFSRHIQVGSSLLGTVTVSMNPQYFKTQYRPLLFGLLGLWLLLCGGLLLLARRAGTEISERLLSLSQRLPTAKQSSNSDEISIIEQQITPLLRTPVSSEPNIESNVYGTALLAIKTHNLARLEAVLNQHNFHALMVKFDQIIAHAVQLYEGNRLRGHRHHEITLEFTNTDVSGDHLSRAIYFASALFRISEQLLNSQGLNLELSGAVIHYTRQPSGSTFMDETLFSEHLHRLHTLLEKAAHDEILLDEDTRQHEDLQELELLPLSEKNAIFRVMGLGEEGEEMLHQQVTVLMNNANFQIDQSPINALVNHTQRL